MKTVAKFFMASIMIFVVSPLLAEPLNLNGVYIHSVRDRADEICSCLKSVSMDCPLNNDEKGFDHVLIFSGDTIIVPTYELGCTVDVIGKGEIIGADIKHFAGACLSPGGVGSFTGFLMQGADLEIEIASITGSSFIALPANVLKDIIDQTNHDEIGTTLDADNGIYTNMLILQKCEGLAPKTVSKIYDPEG